MTLSRRAALRRDSRGTTIVEFAILAPVLLLLIMGLGDLLYQSYVQSILNGAIQKSGRDSAIQGGADQAAYLDQKVAATVQSIARNATWTSSRKSYPNFVAMKPEAFTDSNGNGTRDAGECFDDTNENGTWDADPSRGGQGGADDVTLYTVTVTYPRVFPVASTFGASSTQTVSASTLLKNQPYARQTEYQTVSICS